MKALIRFWRSLSSSEQGRVRKGAALLVSVVASVALRRWMAYVATVGASAFVSASLVAGDAPRQAAKPSPVRYAWIQKAGPYKVERIDVPCINAHVDQAIAPKGVGHTVEGSFESGLAVFRRHYAPHFLVGRDRAGNVRIVQFCPLGKIAAALANRVGGVETNHWARVQIEVAAFSKRAAWQPDAGVMKAYAALLWRLRYVAGVPLRHVANPKRDPKLWRGESGWFNHAGVPENAHWDMGAFRWDRALQIAQSFAPIVRPGHTEPVPAPPAPKPCAAG